VQAGLLRFTALSREQQQQVLKRQPHNCLPPLQRLLQARTVFKPEKMVTAVMALDHAEEVLTKNNDPKAALSLLQPYADMNNP